MRWRSAGGGGQQPAAAYPPTITTACVATTTHPRTRRATVRDPVSGTPMRFHGEMAVLQTPGAGNQLMRHRKFYITKDVDITIQTLRNTTKVRARNTAGGGRVWLRGSDQLYGDAGFRCA
jgi:hypothetical protein